MVGLKHRKIIYFKIFVILIMISCTINGRAEASDPYWLKCDEIKSVVSGEPNIRVGGLADFDGKKYVLVDGFLETSSSGYTYEMIVDGIKQGVLGLKLKLIPPIAGMGVIDKVNIMERMEVTEPFYEVEISIEKKFRWGPDIIKCTSN